MPKTKPDDATCGQIEPAFHWETRIPHTVVLMLKSTEDDLILKACQSLYKFAHEGELNQNLLIQYDTLVLLLDHLEHPNRNVRRMVAMALSELSRNLSVQSALASPENVVRLVRVLTNDDDCMVDELAAGALLRLCADVAGRGLLLRTDAVPALVLRLTSGDPDVLKTCLDTLLLVLDVPEAIDQVVESGGVQNALEVVNSEYPVLQTSALIVVRKLMESEEGRVRLREASGIEKLMKVLENPKLDDLYSHTLSVLHDAIHDVNNILAMHEFGGLKKMLGFIQSTPVGSVLEQCAFLLAEMAQHSEVRELLHALAVEPVLVTSLLSSPHVGSRNGAARGVGHMCLMLEAQEELVRLGIVPLLLKMVGNTETFQSAVVGLSSATRNHQLACRQVCDSQKLEALVNRLMVPDPETVSHTARTLQHLAEQETLRPVVVAGSATEQLVNCLLWEWSGCLVATCQALSVICLSDCACKQVVDIGGTELLMDLLEHEEASVRDACVSTLQVIGADFRAAQQLCSGGAIGSLRALKATPTLCIILEANLSALYSIFGHLRVRHKIYDLFVDCGRQGVCTTVPSLQSLMEEPISHTRIVFLVHSGICPLVSDEQHSKSDRKGLQQTDVTVPERDTLGDEEAEEFAEEETHSISLSSELTVSAKASYQEENVAHLVSSVGGNVIDKAAGVASSAVFADATKEMEQAVCDTRPSKIEEAANNATDTSGDNVSIGKPSTDKHSSELLGIAKTGKVFIDNVSHSKVFKVSSNKVSAEKDVKPILSGTLMAEDAENEEVEDDLPPPDYRLAGFVEEVVKNIAPLESDREQSAALAQFVSDRLGGAVPREHLGTWSAEMHLCKLKRQQRTNVISLGDVRRGGLRCRALLFKFLADRIGLPCTLQRGAGDRHWNTVLLHGDGELAVLEPYLETVVDLMHEPGRLMPPDSADGVEYTRGPSCR